MDAHYQIASIDNPVWRNILFKLFDEDIKTRETGYKHLTMKLRDGIQPQNDMWVPPEDGAKIVALSMQQSFPKLEQIRQRPAKEILNWFSGLSHPLIAETIHQCYAISSSDIQSSAFTFLAGQRDANSFKHLVALLDEHGLPQDLGEDFFLHLTNTPQHGELIINALLLHCHEYIDEVVDLTAELIRNQHIHPAHLNPITAQLSAHIETHIDAMLALQAIEDSGIMQAPENLRLHAQLKSWLRLLPSLPELSDSLLQKSYQLSDPAQLLEVLAALLRFGIEPAESFIKEIASVDHLRAEFLTLLQKHQRIDLYPRQYQAFTDFAACDMASWLMRETQFEPEQLELMSRLVGEDGNQQSQWLLWQFTEGKDSFAAISGPYPINAEAAPMRGQDTFSCFNPWHEATPEQHFDIIIQKLFSWRIEPIGQ